MKLTVVVVVVVLVVVVVVAAAVFPEPLEPLLLDANVKFSEPKSGSN